MSKRIRVSGLCGQLVLLWLVASAAAMAGAPDWLLALRNVQVPEYPPEMSSVALLRERRTVISADGKVRSYHRVAYRILAPEGEGMAQVRASYNEATKITRLRGWNMKPSGVVHETADTDVVVSQVSDFALYDDSRTVAMIIPQVETGSVIGYEYEQEDRPDMLQDSWYFSSAQPVLRSRYLLELPKDWTFEAHMRNVTEIKPQAAGQNRWQWELQNLDAIPIEEGMPPLAEISPELLLAFFPGEDTGRGKAFGTWDDVAKWFGSMMSARVTASPTTAQSFRQFTDIQQAAEFAQKQIRYVAIEIGIGGYQPHPADEIFRNKFGDCKDKVTMLASIAQTQGVKVMPVLINLGGRSLDPEFPSPMYFNHVIAAISIPSPTAGHTATINHEGLGSLLLFDPTDETVPYGMLPSGLQGIQALVVSDDRGYVIETPVSPPAQNRLLRSAKFAILPDGTLKGKVDELYFGDLATMERATLLNLGQKNWIKGVERYLAVWLPGASVERVATSGVDGNGLLQETYDFTVPWFGQETGEMVLFRPLAIGSRAALLPPQDNRKYPFRYSYLRMMSDVFEFTLPPGFTPESLPEGVSRETPYGNYSSSVVLEGNVFKYTRRLEINQLRVPSNDVALLRSFYELIDRDEREVAIFRKGAP